MQDPSVTSVYETDSEMEALIYEGLLTEAGLMAQVRQLDDPLLINAIRQLAPTRFQVVVPNQQAAVAAAIVAEHHQRVAESVPVVENEDDEDAGYVNHAKERLILIGRIVIWLMIIAVILLAVIRIGNLSSHHRY